MQYLLLQIVIIFMSIHFLLVLTIKFQVINLFKMIDEENGDTVCIGEKSHFV